MRSRSGIDKALFSCGYGNLGFSCRANVVAGWVGEGSKRSSGEEGIPTMREDEAEHREHGCAEPKVTQIRWWGGFMRLNYKLSIAEA